MGRRANTAWAERMGYGRRGGTSPTAGITFARYRIKYPDGTGDRRRTSKAMQPTAKAVCYCCEDGFWHNSGVYDVLPDWAHRGGPQGPYTIVDAERIG